MPFIFILGLAGFASALSLRSADPLLPVLALDLDVTLREAALLASAYTLPYAIMQLVLGPVGDAIGKTRLIRISLTVLTVALALSAIAPGYGTVLAARALAGAFAGGIIPASMALIGDRVAYAERQFSISRFLVAVISGQLAGSAISGALAEVAGWRAVFGVSAVVAGLALIMAMVFLKGETDARRAVPVRLHRAVPDGASEPPVAAGLRHRAGRRHPDLRRLPLRGPHAGPAWRQRSDGGRHRDLVLRGRRHPLQHGGAAAGGRAWAVGHDEGRRAGGGAGLYLGGGCRCTGR